MLQASTFDVDLFDSEDSKCKLTLKPDRPYYEPEIEFKATVELEVFQTMVNVRTLSWQLFGAELLQRSGGFLSRRIILNHKEYLVGVEEAENVESGPAAHDKTHIFEPGPFQWEVRLKLPKALPPTFRTLSGRIEYYVAIRLTRKGEEDLERKIILPIVTNFSSDCNLSEMVSIVKGENIKPSGFRLFSSVNNKLCIVLESQQYQYCPYSLRNPCISVHLLLQSQCNEIISEFSSLLSRKTILHHKDRDDNESCPVFASTIPLIPPLLPTKSEEYYIQIPIAYEGDFVNPSRFYSQCIFNEYFLTFKFKTIEIKFCVCVSTWNPNPNFITLQSPRVNRVASEEKSEEKVDHSKNSTVETIKDNKTKESQNLTKKENVVIKKLVENEPAASPKVPEEKKENQKEEETTKSESKKEIKIKKVDDEVDEEEIKVLNGNTILSVAEWPIDKVGQWLESNQLSKFVATFQEQGIDGSALLNLEEKYFPDLGITMIGDVIKLKNALNKLKGK